MNEHELETEARLYAQKQWNATACGELAGDKNSLEYFQRVEKDRYSQQFWAIDYFGYGNFDGKKVLEIGTGQGTDLIQFAKGGADCYGVDITDNHLILTQRNFELHGEKVGLRKADATQLPFPDNHFDCVYSFGVIHHIPEAEKVIKEARRVLKPGGLLMVAFYYKWSAYFMVKKFFFNGLLRGWLFRLGYMGLLSTIESGADGRSIKPYVRLYSKRDLTRLLREFEISDLSCHQLFADHFLPAVLCKPFKDIYMPGSSRLGWYICSKAIK